MEQAPVYVLGHAEAELERLIHQSRVIDPITRRGFLAAGLAPGMRVLDIGSGVGDVAFLTASIVGPEGSVLGVDRVEAPLERARLRAKENGLDNVEFLLGDPSEMEFGEDYDAVIGRYVLMFQPDPTDFLRGVARHAKPGGIVAFHEPDWAGARSHPRCEIYDQCCAWIAEVCRRSGARDRMGVELTAAFLDAGLPAPEMEIGELIGGAETAHDAVELLSELTVSVLNELEHYGVARRNEVGPEDLQARIMAEAIQNRATIIGRSEIVAWSRKP